MPLNTSMTLPEPFDVFVDLSGSRLNAEATSQHLERLRREAGLAQDDMLLFLVPPPGVAVPGVAGLRALAGAAGPALTRALGIVAARRRGLAILQGDWLPGNEAIAALAGLHAADPMIGSVQPRFASPTDDRVFSLPNEQGASANLPRAALPLLPATVLTPEIAAPLLLLPARAVAAASLPAEGPLAVSLPVLLAGLRRKGFRNLVSNRVVVACPQPPQSLYPPPGPNAPEAWQDDMRRARQWLARQPERTLEKVLAGAFTSDGRARILLDARGIGPLHNGTAQAILGFLDGFNQLQAPGFDFMVAASREAAAFHNMARRYPNLRLKLDQASPDCLAAVVLNQPWDLQRLRELHRCSYLLGFNILDTIAWDIIYVAEDQVDRVWRLTAALADMLFFNSAFTRDRYAYRFPVAPDMPMVVTHHSVSPAELTLTRAEDPPVEPPYVLVAGNSYDHKDVERTTRCLSEAFPYLRVVAMGAKTACGPQVKVLRSGFLTDGQIAALESHATAIVFPSYYEGFGLPVVQGLARGRTVIARHSALWDEVAGLTDLPGRIIPFTDDASLVEALGATLSGAPPAALPAGGAREGAPLSWADCAGRILRQIERSLDSDARHAWFARELLLTPTA